MRFALVVMLVLIGCGGGSHEGTGQRITQGDNKESDADASSSDAGAESGDAGACQQVPLIREVCAEPCEQIEKRIEATTCAAGASASPGCYVEIGTGDLYTVASMWELEDTEHFRWCNEEEKQAWMNARTK